MTFIDRALPLAERGFRVFPLIPRKKQPVRMAGEYDHFDAATTDPEQLREWDKQEPEANVGLSPDEIFCYLETDSEAELKSLCADLPPEVWDTTRVSARPDRCYYIYRQTTRTRRLGNKTATREGKDNLFEFKQHRVLVTGPGSIHPKTGGPYVAGWKRIPAMPDELLARIAELVGAEKPSSTGNMDEETKRQTALLDRFLVTYEVATTGEWFNKGKSWYRPIECPWIDDHENQNTGSSTCIVYVEGGGYGFDCKHRCSSKSWKEFRAEVQSRLPDRRFSFIGGETVVTVGPPVAMAEDAPERPRDWRGRYMTQDAYRNVKPPVFLIDGFLVKNSIAMLAGPVAQRKSIVALNIAHALCTGAPLFDYFHVTGGHERVIYLCPEMGAASFVKRVTSIGLGPFIGKTLFVQTMSEKLTALDELDEELPGAVVIVDTITRFIDGNENESEDMRKFAQKVFRLVAAGATVILLHHSKKGSTGSLDDGLRGSSELAAFVDSCWVTELEDTKNPYESLSKMRNVKQRDFECDPFKLKPAPDSYALAIEGEPEPEAVLKSKADDAARAALAAILKETPQMGINKLRTELKAKGHGRGQSWITKTRTELRGSGVTLSSD
jgi:hypothetical protein